MRAPVTNPVGLGVVVRQRHLYALLGCVFASIAPEKIINTIRSRTQVSLRSITSAAAILPGRPVKCVYASGTVLREQAGAFLLLLAPRCPLYINLGQ